MSAAMNVATAVEQAYEAQPAWYRRKSTLINVLQGAGWLLGVLTTLAADWPEWAVLLIGGLSTLVTAGLSALTNGEITPSMVARIARFAPIEPAVQVPTPELAPAPVLPGDYATYISTVGAGEDHSAGENHAD